jgi:hypothetical protein
LNKLISHENVFDVKMTNEFATNNTDN